MGGGASKDHESFTVTPSDAAAAVPGAGAVGELPTSAAYAGLDAAVADIADAGDYNDLAAATAHAGQLLKDAEADGLPPQLLAEGAAAVHGSAKTWLHDLSDAELVSLAAGAGFAHPTLVGLSGGASQPLEHWLDPSYPPDIASKAKIAAKADERYDALKAGESINGLTLADVDAAEAHLPTHLPPGPSGSWQATPADVVAAQSSLTDAVTTLAQAQTTAERREALGQVIAAENTLATATCPPLSETLIAAQGSAKAAVDHAVTPTPSGPVVRPLAEAAAAEGTVPDGTSTVATPAEAIALLRASTSPAERAALTAALVDRQGQLDKLGGLKSQLGDAGVFMPGGGGQNWIPGSASLTLAPLGGSEQNKTAVADFAAAAGEFYATHADAASWVPGSLTGAAGTPVYPAYGLVTPQGLTSGFRAWAKGQPVGELRSTAAAMGMANSESATRAEAQNWIASSWDPTLDHNTIATTVAAKAAAKAATPPSTAGPATPGPSSPAKTKPSGQTPSSATGAASAAPAAGRSFATKHLALVEALKHHNATLSALPARPDPGEVASWNFTAGPAKAALGGMHTKSLHSAPDGSVWMFKPDATKGGRAPAEAAASEIFAHVGVPSVPVYARSVGGKAGTIQPLLSGTSNLASSPSAWSQADVDALVRVHVAAWAVGDHDGKADNLLRTAGGGIIPIDQGQAFKFYGKDKLASSYHPNGSYGAPKAVFHQAYAAAKAGDLGPGVAVRPEAALPVIKAFEAIPDHQYRAMLAKTATDGAAHKVHWYPAMAERAKKRLGKTDVSDSDVAGEFLDYAVARKAGLRAAFAGFFATEGFAGAAKITKVT